MKAIRLVIKKKLYYFLLVLAFFSHLTSCGRVYFPMQLDIQPRKERAEKQEEINVELISMTEKTIADSNKIPYKRRIVEALDLARPAQIKSAETAIKENYPEDNDPGPYVIGVADEISLGEFLNQSNMTREFVTRKLVVSSEGYINISGVGSIKAEGLTELQLEDKVSRAFLREAKSDFEIYVSAFKSKQVFIAGDGIAPTSIPFGTKPLYFDDLLATSRISVSLPYANYKVRLIRDDKTYLMSMKRLIESPQTERLRLFPNDKLFFSILNYKTENVLIVGETGAQRSINISSSIRPMLADIIFNGNVLNTVTSDITQIYVLRSSKKKYRAYHLDISNPVRVNLAGKFEMRPDDIVFVATQPLSLYSRTLSQILGSTGLTLQARDTIRTEIGN